MTGRRYLLDGGCHGTAAVDVTRHGCVLWDNVRRRDWRVFYPTALTRAEAAESLREARGGGFNVLRVPLDPPAVMRALHVHKAADNAAMGG